MPIVDQVCGVFPFFALSNISLLWLGSTVQIPLEETRVVSPSTSAPQTSFMESYRQRNSVIFTDHTVLNVVKRKIATQSEGAAFNLPPNSDSVGERGFPRCGDVL